jgi:hypothetical protein
LLTLDHVVHVASLLDCSGVEAIFE